MPEDPPHDKQRETEMPLVPETRVSLLLRLRDARDHEAWETFLQIYQPLIFRLARRRGIQEADAREIMQEVLMTVVTAIDRWDSDPARGSFRGWLSTVTRNLVVNFLIRQSRHPRGNGDTDFQRWLDQQPDPASEQTALFDREEQKQIFRWAANRIRSEFKDTSWQAFWRTAVDGSDVTGVARELGVTAGHVYVSRSRVMKRLREQIQRIKTTIDREVSR